VLVFTVKLGPQIEAREFRFRFIKAEHRRFSWWWLKGAFQLRRPSLEHVAEAVLLIEPTDALDLLRGFFEGFPGGRIPKLLRDLREGGGGHRFMTSVQPCGARRFP
jgi:hypothetical protein